MSHPKRIIIVGHPGAGKAVCGTALAEILGWEFIDADYGLELKTGLLITDILGSQGADHLHNCEHRILTQHLDNENVIISTDASIVCSEKNRELLKTQYVIFVNVGLATQLERLSRHTAPLMLTCNLENLLKHIHERDNLFAEVASITINTDAGNVKSHTDAILKDSGLDQFASHNPVIKIDDRDLIQLHHISHKPIKLSEQQALCLKLLANGKSAKEIAKELNISYRTVEGHLAKVMELLGCSSSKELISFYLGQP